MYRKSHGYSNESNMTHIVTSKKMRDYSVVTINSWRRKNRVQKSHANVPLTDWKATTQNSVMLRKYAVVNAMWKYLAYGYPVGYRTIWIPFDLRDTKPGWKPYQVQTEPCISYPLYLVGYHALDIVPGWIPHQLCTTPS